jgi:cobyrinic acid a,c-diamide synthase
MNGSAGLVIAGTWSGVGKTSVTLGLARALTRRSLRVQPFKVGPDFLDPTYLARATGRTCYNLDGWMTDRRYVEHLFFRHADDADLALIEGVMGMFDGAEPTSLAGSTAEIAAWLDLPVLLVVDAHGMAGSVAPLVKGFAEFEPGARVVGVLANHVGSPRHGDLLADALENAGLPPLLGAVPKGAFPPLESRHLGLTTADEDSLSDSRIDQLGDACEQHLDMERMVGFARESTSKAVPFDSTQAKTGPRIAVAHDTAFHFTYPDNLEALTMQGAEIVRFSPLADEQLPRGIHGLYLPGGYPELHAKKLSSNRSLLADIRRFAESGGCIHAECGGLMALGRELITVDGSRLPMAGVLPIVTKMRDRRKMLGYVEVRLRQDSLWGPAGSVIRGHEFHYSEIVEDHTAAAAWQPVYDVRRRRCDAVEPAGYHKGNTMAGYPHLHWASRPDIIQHFLAYCERQS